MPTEEIIVIEKTPEQLAEEAAILAHVIVDPQAWIDNAIANNLEWAIQEKVEKYRQDYLDAKYLSITVDPETGIETRVENPDYLNRAERDALEEAARKVVKPGAQQTKNYTAVTQNKINRLLKKGLVSQAIKLNGGL